MERRKDPRNYSTLDQSNPWPGLVPYQEGDREFFRGRDEQVAQLLRALKRARLTILFGRSGLGKTSLLRAGLFPRIRSGEANLLPVYIRLDLSSASPGFAEQVKMKVYEAADAAGVRRPTCVQDSTLWEFLHGAEPENHFWDERHQPVHPVLAFDQFEAVLDLGDDPSQPGRKEASRRRKEFLRELSDVITGSPPAALEDRFQEDPDEVHKFTFDRHFYKVLLSLRESYLPELEEGLSGLGTLMANRVRLRPMNGYDALQVVFRPELIEKEVAERLVRRIAAGDVENKARQPDLGELRVQPALLSLFCHELNKLRRQRRKERISAQAVDQQGESILKHFYEDCFQDLSDGKRARRFVEDELLTDGGNRSAYPEWEAQGRVSARDLQKLVERRLIHREQRRDTVWLELTHDVLTEVVRQSRNQREVRSARRAARRNLSLAVFFGVLLIVTFAALAIAWNYWNLAEQRRQQAEAATREMRAARDAERAARLAAEGARKEAELARNEAEVRRLEAEAARAEAQGKKQEAARYLAQADELRGDLSAARRIAAKDLAEAEEKAGEAEKRAAQAEKSRNQALARARSLRSELKRAQDELSSFKEVLRLDSNEVNATRHRLDSLVISLRSDRLAETALDRHHQDAQLSRWLAIFAASSRLTLEEPVPLKLHQALLLVTGPEKTLQDGGSDVEFGPRGVMLATGDRIDDLEASKIWDLSTDESRPLLPDVDETIQDVAFSPGGSALAAGAADGRLFVHHLAQDRQVLSFKAHESIVTSVAYSPDGARFATSGFDGKAWTWDAATGRKTGALPAHRGEVYLVVYSPDGGRLATGAGDGLVRIWSAAGHTVEARLSSHERVFALAFAPDGRSLASGGLGGGVRIWDLHSFKEVGHLPMAEGGSVRTLAFHPTKPVLAAGGSTGAAVLWDAESGSRLLNLGFHKDTVESVAFSPDGMRLATTDMAGTIRIFLLEVPDLLKLALSRATDPLTPKQCREHLRMDPCPTVPQFE